MLHFRKMDIDDLQVIYSNNYLKPLLTVPPIGEKFGILIDENGNIRGGLTGYTHGQGAMIQMIKVEEGAQQSQFIEGLLRAAAYMLDRDNIKIIFTKDDIDDVFTRVGFNKSKDLNKFLHMEIGEIIINDIREDLFGFLDIDNFFNHTCT